MDWMVGDMHCTCKEIYQIFTFDRMEPAKKCSWFTHQLIVLALYVICSIFSSFPGCETFTAFQRDNTSLISDQMGVSPDHHGHPK